MGVLFEPDQDPVEVTPFNGKKFTLDEVQTLIGGKYGKVYAEARRLGCSWWTKRDCSSRTTHLTLTQSCWTETEGHSTVTPYSHGQRSFNGYSTQKAN